MKLNRLRVDQFRRFRQPIELTFESGLNLFCGPNESGKSTLVRAIRAAFFERYSTSSVDDLRPWGDSSAAPEVEIEFDFNGERWRLNKRFLARKRCDLLVNSRESSNEEAESQLAELLGYQFSSRGASKAEHWGVPGLLWIEQGSTQELDTSVHYASDHLQSALGDDIASVASSSGDELLRKVTALRAELLTERGQPRATYKESIAQVASLETDLKELDERIRQYQHSVDRLGELREQTTREEREKPWESLEAQLSQARIELDSVNALATEQETIDQKIVEKGREGELIESRLKAFSQEQQDLDTREKELIKLRSQKTELEERKRALKPEIERLGTAYEEAFKLQQLQRDKQQRQELEKQIGETSLALTKRQKALDGARALQAELLGFQKELQPVRLESAVLKHLEQLQAKVRDLQIRQQSIATRLRYSLLEGVSLELGSNTLVGEGEQLLTDPQTLTIPGIGQLQIEPGGEDLNEISRALIRASRELEEALSKHQLKSVSEAVERVDQSRQLESKITQLESTLKGIAPEGVDTLVSEVELGSDRCETLKQRLESMPVIDVELPSEEVLGRELKNTEAALQQQQKNDASLRDQLTRLDAQLESGHQEFERLNQRISAPERQSELQKMVLRRQELTVDLSVLKQKQNELEQRINAARPDILEQDIKRLTLSLNSLRQKQDDRAAEIIRLEGMLSGQGADGLEEQRAQCAAELDSTERRKQQLEARANALDLLQTRLSEKRNALTKRLQAPLISHINHYMNLLFPGAQIEVDDKLVPNQLTRQGEVMGFNDLSFGAREQMGLISRLAYADLLKASGQPTLIILDDALVHSDRERLTQMKRILFDAAQRHQILIFSCHPEDWNDLGVDVQELRKIA